MLAHEGNESIEATSTSGTGESTSELPCFDSQKSSPEVPLSEEPPEDQFFVRPLSESVLDEQSEFVLNSDDETVEMPACPLLTLAPLLNQSEPLTWLFAGARLGGDPAFGDDRLIGEWFAEEWRAESGRATDLVIDATWPDCTLTLLKSHLKTRVVRHRPGVAFLFFDRSDASDGVEQLPQFERRLVAVLSVLSEIGAVPVLVQTPLAAANEDIDAEIYFEAISGIARERNVCHLVLPQPSTHVRTCRTPDSPARNAALYFCRELKQTM